MVDALDIKLWGARLAVAALCLAVIFFRLLPLDALPARMAGPDLMLALIFALAVRRADAVPAWAVAGLMLLADMVFQRPPGLWAALSVIFVESLRTRARTSRDQGFVMEWAAISASLIVMALIYQIVLLVLIIPTANGPLLAMQTVMTILLYPLVAGLVQVLFGRRRGRTDSDRMGLG